MNTNVENESSENLKTLIIYAVQHIAAMCAGAIAVPIILGGALGLEKDQIQFLVSATLMVSGIGTIIQTVGLGKKIGSRLLMIEGASFAGVAALTSVAGAYSGENAHLGLGVMFGATIISGIFTLIFAPVVGKMIKYFPNLVSGTVVTCMGLSLLPVAIRWIGGGNTNSPTFGTPSNLLLAAFTLIVILFTQKFCKGFIGNIALLIGLFVGTIVSIIFGMADFSALETAKIINFNIPFYFGLPKFEISAVLSLILVQMVIMTDATGNQINLTDISKKELTKEELTAGLRGHGLSTVLGGIFNSFPQSLFGQNVGVVALTQKSNRFIGCTAGIMLLAVSIFPKLTAILTAIPYPVLGGAGIIMFGMVAANGIKRLGTVNYDNNKNLVIVATSIGMALIPIAVPGIYNHFPLWATILFKSAITLGALTVIILNILFNEIGNKDK